MLLCSGCYSHRVYSWNPVTLTGPGWVSFHGQALWKPTPRVPELAGDVFAAVNTNSGSAFIQFSKTLPFLTAQLNTLRWEVDIPSQSKTYSGGYPLPSHFAWLQLPAVLQGQSLTRPWMETGDFLNWEIRNPNTGESLRGYFNLP